MIGTLKDNQMVSIILNYLKIREEVDRKGGSYMRIWYPDKVDTIYVEDDRTEPN